MIVDAKDLIVGRVASFCAKKSLLGEEVVVINVDKAVISGSKKNVIAKYKRKNELGEPHHGPFFPKTPMKFVKRIIRGMLPYKQEKGRSALKRIKCYPDNPANVTGITIEKAHLKKLKNSSYITVSELCKHLKG